MNEAALIAVAVFAGALLAIVGAIYIGASKSHRRGELGSEGLKILRWALVGYAGIYVVLALSAFLA